VARCSDSGIRVLAHPHAQNPLSLLQVLYQIHLLTIKTVEATKQKKKRGKKPEEHEEPVPVPVSYLKTNAE
jgi:hypothetical protein